MTGTPRCRCFKVLQVQSTLSRYPTDEVRVMQMPCGPCDTLAGGSYRPRAIAHLKLSNRETAIQLDATWALPLDQQIYLLSRNQKV